MTTTKTAQHEKWVALIDSASKSAHASVMQMYVEPMVVYSPKVPFFDESPDLSQPVYHVPDGPCGFAWVNLSAVKGPEGKEARQFINWLTGRTAPAPGCEPPTGHGHAYGIHKSYWGGHDLWIKEYSQSIQKKAKHASVLASILNEHVPGLRAYSSSRLD